MRSLWPFSRRKAKGTDAERLVQFAAALGRDPAMISICKTIGHKWLSMETDEQQTLKHQMNRVARATQTVSALSAALKSFQSVPMDALTLAIAWGFILRGLVEDGEVNL